MGFIFNIGWWVDPRMGWTAAGKELNINFSEVGPVDFNGAQQATMFEQLIAKKPDGILHTPADPDQLVEPCKKATEAGIPLIVFNSDIRDTRWRLGLIGMQNFNGGFLQGQYIVQNVLKDKAKGAKVLIMTIPGVENHESRKAGLTKALQDAGATIKQVVNDKADYTEGPKVATAALQANPDINLIVATDATGGESAARAVVELGKKPGDITIFGMDRDDSMLKYITDGYMVGTAVQRNFVELYQATYYAYWHLKQHHEAAAFPGAPKDAYSKLPAQVIPITDTGVMFATKENVDYFYHKKT
jgi:ribose transport system substrate-binding protein